MQNEIIDYDVFQKMKALDNRQDLDGNDFGYHSCCDYLDSLVQEGDRFGVVMFVEPCGNLIKWGNSWSEVLDWWIAVFKLQPENWNYARAGWWLLDMSEKGFSDDPNHVFPVTINAEACQPRLRWTGSAGDYRKARGVLKDSGVDPVEDVRKLRGG